MHFSQNVLERCCLLHGLQRDHMQWGSDGLWPNSRCHSTMAQTPLPLHTHETTAGAGRRLNQSHPLCSTHAHTYTLWQVQLDFSAGFLSVNSQILKVSSSPSRSSSWSFFAAHALSSTFCLALLSLLSARLCPFDQGRAGASYLFSSPVEPGRLRAPMDGLLYFRALKYSENPLQEPPNLLSQKTCTLSSESDVIQSRISAWFRWSACTF